MCNDYERRVSWAAYRMAMQQLELGIPTNQNEVDLPQADDIPGQRDCPGDAGGRQRA